MLPFTTAEQLRSCGSRMLCVRPHEVERIVTLATSGTEGDPKRVFFTADDLELTVDFFRHGMATFTGAGDRVVVLMPGARPGSIGDLLQSALARLGASAVVHGPVVDIDETLALLERTQASVVVGIPIQVLGLARRSVALGRPIRSVHSVLLSADHVPRAVVHAVETSWRCRVFDHYGSTEMGFGGGVECVARGGYHLREADLLFEIVSPDSGLPLADGEVGEIVFSTLTRTGMPLLRYRTGDVSRFLPGRCECGTHLRRLAPVGTRPAAAAGTARRRAASPRRSRRSRARSPRCDRLRGAAWRRREARRAAHRRPAGGGRQQSRHRGPRTSAAGRAGDRVGRCRWSAGHQRGRCRPW